MCRDEEMACDDAAVEFVRKRRKDIERLAAARIRSTPYDMDDVMQDAYTAAFLARRTHRELELTFSRCFWGLFAFRLKSLCATSVWARPMLDGEQTEAAAPPDDLPAGEDLRVCEELLRWSISVMCPRQAEVWRMMLSGGRPTTEWIAGRMRIRRQSVEELQKRGLMRVRKKVSRGALPPRLVAVLEEGRSLR